MSGPTTDKTTPSVVVFASGRGSNFRALCDAVKQGRLPVKIEALVTNVSGSGATEVARAFQVPVVELPHKGLQREAHERLVLKALEALACDWVVLAGYMRLFSPDFVRRFWDERLSAARIVNIHPSLLPAFPGTDAYGQALRYGVKITGATVHLVGSGLDDGPILMQRALEVREDDTAETLTTRGLKLEHDLYIEALTRLVKGHWNTSMGPDGNGRPRLTWSKP